MWSGFVYIYCFTDGVSNLVFYYISISNFQLGGYKDYKAHVLLSCGFFLGFLVFFTSYFSKDGHWGF